MVSQKPQYSGYDGERIYVTPRNLIPIYRAPRRQTGVIVGDTPPLTVIVDNENPQKYILLTGYDTIFSRYLSGGRMSFEAKIVTMTSQEALAKIIETKEKLQARGVTGMSDLFKKLKPLKK